MDWNAFAQEVHQNAVEHGFWEGERPIEEVFALIHSEWSEAMEAYRKDEPMVWYDEERGHKPEGIAVELVDGCIRILDFLAEEETGLEKYATIENVTGMLMSNMDDDDEIAIPHLICSLHDLTARSLYSRMELEDFKISAGWLFDELAYVNIYLSKNGLDPESLMREKHEYNKTRPYKHGKKC